MNIETIRSFLLWCTIISYGLLVLWAVLGLRGDKNQKQAVFSRFFAGNRPKPLSRRIVLDMRLRLR